MAFHGLFIGIDRFASPRINELNCARRDGVALHDHNQVAEWIEREKNNRSNKRR
jgi:hypothetical protein